MVSVRFARIAEEKSQELAESLVKRLQASPTTAAYAAVDAEELQAQSHYFFRSLTHWLSSRRPDEIPEICFELGSLRCQQGIPMDQAVCAMLSGRDLLMDLMRRESGAHKEGLFGELEFAGALNHLFDDAVFHLMRGYRGKSSEKPQVA